MVFFCSRSHPEPHGSPPLFRPSYRMEQSRPRLPLRDLPTFLPKAAVSHHLKISPSHTRPQCPWDVYSHRHTSAITRSSGIRFLMWRIARCVTPSSFVNYLFACYAIPLVIFATRLWMAALKNRITNAVNSITSAMDVAPRVIKFLQLRHNH